MYLTVLISHVSMFLYLLICKAQCCEKVFAPFPISSIFAYLSHLNVSDHQTNFNMRQSE